MPSEENHTDVEYHSEQYNKFNDTEQWIRLSDGCFRNCWNCHAPTKKIHYDLPEIIRNKVVIMDMNFLWAFPKPLETIKKLGEARVNGKVVYYDFLCGLDYGLITHEIAEALHENRFGHFNSKRNFIKGLRIAWDRSFDEQKIIKNAIYMFRKAGYQMKATQIFVLVNGKVSFSECVRKLDLMKVWNVQIGDCWYDNQIRGSVIPEYWTNDECKEFGKMCRKHNQYVNFGVDPEWKK